MAAVGRPAKGNIKITKLKGGSESYTVRFQAYGARRTQFLGRSDEGWSRDRADVALRHIQADVERGTWRPHVPAAHNIDLTDPTFHEMASDYLARMASRGQRESTKIAMEHEVIKHLLPHFATMRLSQFNAATVVAFREHEQITARSLKDIRATLKAGTAIHQLSAAEIELVERFGVRHRLSGKLALSSNGLNATSINKCITRLAAILESGMRDHPDVLRHNPAKFTDVRVIPTAPEKTWLTFQQLEMLAQVAEELEAKARGAHRIGRPALVGALFLGGLRVSEMGDLDVGDVDFITDQLWVKCAKTDAGVRSVNMVPKLRTLLENHVSQLPDADPKRPLFLTAQGRRRNRANIRKMLNRMVAITGERLARQGVRMNDTLPSHAGRRTFVTLSIQNDELPKYVQRQVGHRDPAFTLRVYNDFTTARIPFNPTLREWFGKPTHLQRDPRQ